jgi:hypothetical protein
MYFLYFAYSVEILGSCKPGLFLIHYMDDPGFQVRGRAHLKKLRRAEGGAKSFGVFRMKNHDFTPKNRIFSNFRGEAEGGEKISGVFRVKNHIFPNFRGARAGFPPPWIRPCTIFLVVDSSL